jgi:TnpA family transposase
LSIPFGRSGLIGYKSISIPPNKLSAKVGLLVRGAIKPRLFLAHWDDLLRAAGSLKLGWVTASLLIAKLQSSRRKNVLTRALQEYGRLNKTIFMVRI